MPPPLPLTLATLTPPLFPTITTFYNNLFSIQLKEEKRLNVPVG